LNIDPGQIAVAFAVFLFSTTVHEAAHAWMAWKWGDSTAKDLGRITLNPIPHIDPVGTVIVPLATLIMSGGIMGWASTPVDKSRMRDPRWGDFWTSAAGPLSNLMLAIVSFVLLKVVLRSSLGDMIGDFEAPVSALLWTGVWLNIVLMILNLLPIPPLDGSHLLQNLLPDSLADIYEQVRPFGLILLIVVGASGLLGRLVNPVIFWARSLL
jgi:Zn-dependent protease